MNRRNESTDWAKLEGAGMIYCADCGHAKASHDDSESGSCFEMTGFAHSCECDGFADPDLRSAADAIAALRARLEASDERRLRISRYDAALLVDWADSVRSKWVDPPIDAIEH